ncbi:MAG: hypothetical protein ACT4P1_11425 [Sporichthyaceae bacterium]
MTGGQEQVLLDLLERMKAFEQEAEQIKNILIVKDPSRIAAEAFDGLRKAVLAGAAERRSHLVQLVTMSVAVSRATSVDDLVPQVQEWMEQAGVQAMFALPAGQRASDYFDDLGGAGLAGPIEVVEPAYVDTQNDSVIRLGRAKLDEVAAAAIPNAPGPDVTDSLDAADRPATERAETQDVPA